MLFIVYFECSHTLGLGKVPNDNNNNFIYIAPLKTMFTKCSTESQSKTSGIAKKQYYI